MIVLVIFAFIAGVVTILSPCILPVLPIVLSESSQTGKKRPLGVVTGFVASFTIFTLFLTWLVNKLGLPAESLRTLAAVVILVFGISYLFPKTQLLIELLFAKIPKPQTASKEGFGGGVLMGLAIGLVWTPCVGPILASVISLAVSGTVTLDAFVIMFAYALGTSIPMFLVIKSGQGIIGRFGFLQRNLGKIQIGFGALMIVTSLLIFTNSDRKFQAFVLDKFPSWGRGLTSFEDNKTVESNLNQLSSPDESAIGLSAFPMAPEIIPGGQWFNLPDGKQSLTLEELKGNVVLVDFWTYTCINCIRTLPYIRTWYDKYKDDGFVVIGVHTPEFEFEKDADNVAGAIADFNLTYPIIQDNNYSTWRAYKNRYWPAKYLIDAQGRIRYTHFGEGDYDETEMMIQKLLNEAGQQVNADISNPNYQVTTQTPETYLGYARMQGFASKEAVAKDVEKTYSLPATLPQNNFAYGGNWTVMSETAKAGKGSKLALQFFAKNVFLVMRSEDSAEVQIKLDGQVINAEDSGKDAIQGTVVISKDRLYDLVNLDKPGWHELVLEVVSGEVEMYAFTFG